MNHLREFLDTPDDQILESDDMTPEQIDAAFTGLEGFWGAAVCFWIGHFEPGQSSNLPEAVPVLCERMPYANCWFEYSVARRDGRTVINAAAVRETPEDKRRFMVWFQRCAGSWAIRGMSIEMGDETLKFCPDDPMLSVQGFGHGGLMGIVNCFLTAMNCKSVKRIETVPAAKLQKARGKRGKAPLFSYWTLELAGRSDKAMPMGGTHAGPRVHLRRGHPRQFKPGEWTWVQAATVGSLSAGMVHKDYSAAALLAQKTNSKKA